MIPGMRRLRVVAVLILVSACAETMSSSTSHARLTAKDIVQRASPAIVRIEAGAEKIGTGFILDKTGVVATNLHVVIGESAIRVKLSDGSQYAVNRATGVVLQGGEEIQADIVASNLTPHLTFLNLLEPAELPADFLDAIRKYRSEGTSCKINLALSGLPNFRALPGDNGPQHRATMHICPSIEYVEKAWDDAKYGRPSQSPLLELTVPTMYDPSLAPAGKHIMGIFLQYAPYTLRDANWDEMREPFAYRSSISLKNTRPVFDL